MGNSIMKANIYISIEPMRSIDLVKIELEEDELIRLQEHLRLTLDKDDPLWETVKEINYQCRLFN